MKKRILFFLLTSCLAVFMALLNTGCTQKTGVTALWEAGKTRDKIVVISDIHIGIKDEYAEMVENRPLLIHFLQRLQRTSDVRELVIAGDFLDEWFLPVYYPGHTDSNQFYKDVIANNQDVIDALNNVIKSGIKLVYVPGNHDMTLNHDILQKAIPKIVQAGDAKGLGTYYTGDRNEIAIEHGHRYDVFSAPDTVTNAELCGNDDTILPAGYFYARYAATWVLEGRPKVEKALPVITNIPDKSDIDQYGAFLYYSVLKTVSERLTPNERPDEKIFDMHIAGFNHAYSYLDFYPVRQPDGTISAPVLFKNIQRTWGERQRINQVKIPNSFIEAVGGTLDWEYYFRQAKVQYLENPNEKVDVVVFGHTHVPACKVLDNGKYYVNDGTWIDHNTDDPTATRLFAVITTGAKTKAGLYRYEEDGAVTDITTRVGSEKSTVASATNPFDKVTYDFVPVGNDSDDIPVRYIVVDGLTDRALQEKLNKGIKDFCLEPVNTAESSTTYSIMPAFEVVGGDLLSIRTYQVAYTTDSAYPVGSIRTQLFSLTTGEKVAWNLWDFIKSKEVFKQMVLDGKLGLAIMDFDGDMPKELMEEAFEKLARSIDMPEMATQFFFGDGGSLNIWCEGERHATGDYWLFDIPVMDLEEMATDRLRPIMEALKKLAE